MVVTQEKTKRRKNLARANIPNKISTHTFQQASTFFQVLSLSKVQPIYKGVETQQRATDHSSELKIYPGHERRQDLQKAQVTPTKKFAVAYQEN